MFAFLLIEMRAALVSRSVALSNSGHGGKTRFSNGLSMIAQTKPSRSKIIVVIGNGMVGHRFVERLVEFDTGLQYQIVAFCEEPRPAYNRVNLTKFFEYKDSGPLMMAKPDWYHEKSVSLFVGDRAVEIDRGQRIVRSREGRNPIRSGCAGDWLVRVCSADRRSGQAGRLRLPHDRRSARILEYAKHSRSAAVIGGGLLGLEAAKAAVDLGLEYACGRSRSSIDAAAVRRRRLAAAGRQDRRTRSPRPHWKGPERNLRRRKGWRVCPLMTGNWTSTWSSWRPAFGPATNWPGHVACGSASAAAWWSTTCCGLPTRSSSPSARWPCTVI